MIQWRIQDFPQVGAWTLQGEGVNTQFAKFSQKLHEIERIWTPGGGGGGGVRPSPPPLDSPLGFVTDNAKV